MPHPWLEDHANDHPDETPDEWLLRWFEHEYQRLNGLP